MPQISVVGNRNQLIDRVSQIIVKSYDIAAVAPHAVTTRWSYTPPAGGKVIMQVGGLAVLRDGAPGAAGQSFAAIADTLGAALLIAYLNSATVGANVTRDLPNAPNVDPTETWTGITRDLSTTGTNRFTLYSRFLEFII